jgi:Skp family chaperone for outer membrane proteins
MMNDKITVSAIVFLILWSGFLSYQLYETDSSDLPEGIRDGKFPAIAFVHGDSIQANYTFILDQEKEMFIALQQAQMSIERKSRPMQEEAQELIAYANGPSATNDEVMMAQSRLMEIENLLNQMQSQQQTELMQMESVIQGDIAVKLSEEVASFANESGLDLVLNWGRSGEGVLYGNSGFDVTASLTEYMNERYVPEADSLKIERTK